MADSVNGRNGPLTPYNNIATMGAVLLDGQRLLKDALRTLEPTTKLRTTCPIDDNMILSNEMTAGTDDECNAEQRMPSPMHGGFLDHYYTPKFKTAGTIRTLVMKVAMRTCMKAMKMAKDILNLACEVEASSGNWIPR